MSRVDPYRRNRFLVEVDDLVSANFAEVRGLEARAGLYTDPDDVPDTDERDRRTGGFFGDVREAIADAADAAAEEAARLSWIDPQDWPSIVNWTEPGTANPPVAQRRAEFPLLELTRGVTDDRELEDWLADWIAGQVGERSVRIELLDSEGTPARAWECTGAIPVRWAGPELIAERSGVARETLAVAHAGIAPVAID